VAVRDDVLPFAVKLAVFESAGIDAAVRAGERALPVRFAVQAGALVLSAVVCECVGPCRLHEQGGYTKNFQ